MFAAQLRRCHARCTVPPPPPVRSVLLLRLLFSLMWFLFLLLLLRPRRQEWSCGSSFDFGLLGEKGVCSPAQAVSCEMYGRVVSAAAQKRPLGEGLLAIVHGCLWS